jgi:hypothetical protein
VKLAMFALALFWGTTSLVVGQNASNPNADRSMVVALENAWSQAQERHDSKALDRLLDDSFIDVEYDGSSMNKKAFLAAIGRPSWDEQELVIESMTVQVYRGSAVVTGVYRAKGSHQGKPYLRRGRFTDTWVNQNGNWLCVASQSTLISR